MVEVDGIQHTWARELVPDALRHNAVTLGNARVLRMPLLGLRVDPDQFFGQIEQALVAAGWRVPVTWGRRTLRRTSSTRVAPRTGSHDVPAYVMHPAPQHDHFA